MVREKYFLGIVCHCAAKWKSLYSNSLPMSLLSGPQGCVSKVSKCVNQNPRL